MSLIILLAKSFGGSNKKSNLVLLTQENIFMRIFKDDDRSIKAGKMV